MTAPTQPAFPAPRIRARMSEAEFQQWVTDLAELRRWRVYHTYDSRRSPGGFPDLVMVREGVLIFAELKSERGRITTEQRDWLADLDMVALWAVFEIDDADPPPVSVFVWRPSDMEAIEEVLR